MGVLFMTLSISLLNALPGHVAVINSNGMLAAANDSWRQLVSNANIKADKGIDNSADFLGVLRNLNIFSPDDINQITNGLKDILAGHSKSFYQSCQSIMQGEERCHDLRISPFLQDGVRNGLAILVDVTDVKQAENAANLSRYVIRTSPTLIQWIDSSGTVFFINDTACAFYAKSSEEIVGHKIWEIDNFVSEENWTSLWMDVQEKDSITEERHVSGADGQQHILECRLSYTRSDQHEFLINASRDITEQREATRLLHQSEERFYKAFQATDIIIEIHRKRDHTYLEVNDGFCRATGYSREDVIGKTPVEIGIWVSQEDRQKYNELYNRDGYVRNFKSYFRKKTGEIIVGLLSGNTIELDDEACIINVNQDITELEQKAAALQESEERFRVFMDHFPGHVFMKDAECRMLYVNKRFMEAFPDKDVIGKTDLDIFPSKQAKEMIQRDHLALEQGSDVTIERLTYQDGTDHLSETHKFRIDRGEAPPMLGGIALDVTERVEYENRLKEAQRIAKLGNSIYDVQTGKLTWSEELYRMTRLDPSRPAPSREEAYSRFHPDDLMLYESHFHRAKQEGIPFTMDYRFRDWSDEEHWFSISLFPQRNDIGEIYRTFSTIMDITERKKLEMQLLQSQKMEGIGRLAGGIAHDFNNLLTVMIGYGEMAEESLPESSPVQYHIQQILKASYRAADLTQQLLAFARRQIIEPKVVRMNDLVIHTESLLQRILGEDVKLITYLAEDIGRVRVDQGQMEQVLMNLAINARDAMPTGGTLLIETKNVSLGDEYTKEKPEVKAGSYVMIAVTDTGVGMTKEVQSQIFEPFFTTKEHGKGTGLGLATCYGIVKQNEGHIWVYSEPGKGTTFRIYLPRCEDKAELKESPERAERPRGMETILLVEDEPLVRSISKATLRAQGYTILEAENGLEALQLASEYPDEIHLLVTDVVMPEISGAEAAERIKNVRPDIRVLYVSGYTENTVVHHGVLEEGIQFLPKPFTPSALAHKVREILDIE
jgi:PAS domain S-box-containing protein